MIKSIFCLFFIFLTLAFLDRSFFKANGSFSPHCIAPNWKNTPTFITPPPPFFSSIFAQPFTYLTKGKESFVFVSADHKWVIKFLRLPKSLRKRSRQQDLNHYQNAYKTLEGFKNGYENLSTETQIFYAHLRPTVFLKKKIHLIDKLGYCHTLDLDTLPFVLQRYGSPFFLAFEKVQDKKLLIQKTVELFKALYEKGYIDQDPIFDKNFGVIQELPFIMDVGKLVKLQTPLTRVEYLRIMLNSLSGKLQKDFPELLDYYEKLLH